MFMNSKGFTLVELLVVIVVMGIITGMTIPLIRNAQLARTNKKYDTYLKNLTYSAKLYVNSYEEDLFGREENGCIVVSYSDLTRRRLLKDIDLKDISCNSDKTLVMVEKSKGQYTYTSQLGCGEALDGNVSDPVIYPEGSNISISSCG